MESMVSWWYDFHHFWLSTFKGPVLVVNYEDMKQDPIAEVRKILAFMNWEITEDQIQCVKNDMEGNFHRPKPSKENELSFGSMPKNVQSMFQTKIDKFVEDFRDNDRAKQMNLLKSN